MDDLDEEGSSEQVRRTWASRSSSRLDAKLPFQRAGYSRAGRTAIGGRAIGETSRSSLALRLIGLIPLFFIEAGVAPMERASHGRGARLKSLGCICSTVDVCATLLLFVHGSLHARVTTRRCRWHRSSTVAEPLAKVTVSLRAQRAAAGPADRRGRRRGMRQRRVGGPPDENCSRPAWNIAGQRLARNRVVSRSRRTRMIKSRTRTTSSSSTAAGNLARLWPRHLSARE